MSKQDLNERIREIAAKAARENDLEFVHSEVLGSKKNQKVRIFIDKPEGITHEDCALVSQEVGAVLDAEDLIPDAYVLEVSSPGLERGLYSLEDFERFSGQAAVVKVNRAINGQKNFRGQIIEVSDDEIIFDDKTSGKVRFPYSTVVKANLEVDLEEELKKSR